MRRKTKTKSNISQQMTVAYTRQDVGYFLSASRFRQPFKGFK